jgi:hypothetical protein
VADLNTVKHAAPTERLRGFLPGRCTVSCPSSAFSTVMLSPPFRRVSVSSRAPPDVPPLPPAVICPEQRPLAVDGGTFRSRRSPSRSFRVSILLLAVTRSMTKRSCVRVSGSQRSITIPSR